METPGDAEKEIEDPIIMNEGDEDIREMILKLNCPGIMMKARPRSRTACDIQIGTNGSEAQITM